MFLRAIVLANALLLLFPIVGSPQTEAHPDVNFAYSPIFDGPCGELTRQPIEAEAIEELARRLDTFRESWRKEAPNLLGATVERTGVPFTFRETMATLHLCRGFGSMSNPLLINMRSFMKTLEGERAGSATQFSNVVFHELLHRYVNGSNIQAPARTTILLTKYRDEPVVVLNHLHLYAIMNEVYRTLGREKDLATVIAFEQTVKTAPFSKRARQIVDKEGPEPFIRELQDSYRRTGGSKS
jgi:hypothetical protein